jgi:hypothetical protein
MLAGNFSLTSPVSLALQNQCELIGLNWTAEATVLQSDINNTDALQQEQVKFLGQAVMAVFTVRPILYDLHRLTEIGFNQSFNINPSSNALDLYNSITTNTSDATLDNLLSLVTQLGTKGAAPVLYISAVAGGVLILLALVLIAGEYPSGQ